MYLLAFTGICCDLNSFRYLLNFSPHFTALSLFHLATFCSILFSLIYISISYFARSLTQNTNSRTGFNSARPK